MSIFAGKTAVIIEDDASSIKVLQQLLKQVGVSTGVLQDSYTIGEQIASLDSVDVIFLDLEMPFSNGYNVLELIQQSQHLAGVPVVAYTTHTSHLNEAKRAGFHSFLGKPLDGRHFAEQLGKILSGEAVWEVPS